MNDEELIRLRNFAQHHITGGCKILSLGDGCMCPLCDIARINAIIAELKTEIETPQRLTPRPGANE